MDLKSKIREIPDWPKLGVNFKDITTLLENKDTFREAINLLAAPFSGQLIDKVVGIDARGFLLAAPALAQAKDTDKIALAPNFDLFFVPSNFNIASSIFC